MFMTLDEAFTLMNLREPYTEAELKKTYRKMVKMYHPDYHPGDKVAEDMMKNVNEANDILDRYLKDPIAVKNESARNAAYRQKYDAQEAENKRKAEEQRRKEEQRKQAEEQRKKAEEQRKRDAERLKREAEEQKRREEAEKLERRMLHYESIELFKLSGINYNDYIAHIDVRKKLDDMYYTIKTCYEEKEDYIEDYRYENRITGANPFSKENQDRKRKVKIYEEEIRENFKDIKTSTKTFFLYYGEYFDYGNVLDKISNKDLKAYIFADEDEKKQIKKKAIAKLKEYTELQKEFLNPVEQIEMKEINASKRARNYYDEIELQKDIESFVSSNYYINNGKLLTKDGASRGSYTILRSFYKEYEVNSSNLLYGLRYHISNVMNMALRIHEICPEIGIFDVVHNFKKVADLTTNYDFLINYYKLTCRKNFDKCYKCLVNMDNNPKLEGIKTLDDLYNILLMMLNRYNKIPDISAFNREITLEELALMSEEEYQKLLKETLNNSNLYSETVKNNPEVKDYQLIFTKYPKMFKGMSYQKAMEIIAARYEYIKRKKLRGNIVELFKFSDEELNKLVHAENRSKKIEFIKRHNKQYEFKTQTSTTYIDFDKDPDNILQSKTDKELDYIYKQTFMDYVNKNHPEIKITSEQYDRMDDHSREELLEDINFDIRLREIALKTRIYLKTPMSYEQVRNLDGKELEELENQISLREAENFFTGGGSRK